MSTVAPRVVQHRRDMPSLDRIQGFHTRRGGGSQGLPEAGQVEAWIVKVDRENVGCAARHRTGSVAEPIYPHCSIPCLTQSRHQRRAT